MMWDGDLIKRASRIAADLRNTYADDPREGEDPYVVEVGSEHQFTSGEGTGDWFLEVRVAAAQTMAVVPYNADVGGLLSEVANAIAGAGAVIIELLDAIADETALRRALEEQRDGLDNAVLRTLRGLDALEAAGDDVEDIGDLADEIRSWLASPEPPEPIPMILFCPACGLQHIDAADPEAMRGRARSTWAVRHPAEGPPETGAPDRLAELSVLGHHYVGDGDAVARHLAQALIEATEVVAERNARRRRDSLRQSGKAASLASDAVDEFVAEKSAHDALRKQVEVLAAAHEADAGDVRNGDTHRDASRTFARELRSVLDGKPMGARTGGRPSSIEPPMLDDWRFLGGVCHTAPGAPAGVVFTSLTAARDEDGIGVVVSWNLRDGAWHQVWGCTEDHVGPDTQNADPLPASPPLPPEWLAPYTFTLAANIGETFTDEAAGKQWDHDVTWDGDPVVARPALSDDLRTRIDTAATNEAGQVQVVAFRPHDIGGAWVCFYTRAGTISVLGTEFWEPDDEIEFRFGWAEPGAIERMPEFEGW